MSGKSEAGKPTPGPYEPPTCKKCGDEYYLPDGYEATEWCDPCAQELVPELLEALKALVQLVSAGGKFLYVKEHGLPITNADQEIIDHAFILAEAAIRKAEGR